MTPIYMGDDPPMARGVVKVFRDENPITNRLCAVLDTGLTIFITQDDIYDQHRHFPAGTFAENPCRFAGMILGFDQ